MTITIERGTESTASAVDFTGTVNLRRMNVRKDVAEAATKELTRAIGGNTFDAMRLGSILSGQLGISEAFTSSDFKYAAFKELDTEMQRQYAELPAVASIDVTVHKPEAQLPVDLADVSITLTRSRIR